MQQQQQPPFAPQGQQPLVFLQPTQQTNNQISPGGSLTDHPGAGGANAPQSQTLQYQFPQQQQQQQQNAFSQPNTQLQMSDNGASSSIPLLPVQWQNQQPATPQQGVSPSSQLQRPPQPNTMLQHQQFPQQPPPSATPPGRLVQIQGPNGPQLVMLIDPPPQQNGAQHMLFQPQQQSQQPQAVTPPLQQTGLLQIVPQTPPTSDFSHLTQFHNNPQQQQQFALATPQQHPQQFLLQANGSTHGGSFGGSTTNHNTSTSTTVNNSINNSINNSNNNPLLFGGGGSRTSPHTQSPNSSMNRSLSTRAPVDIQRWGFAIVDPYHTGLQRVPIPPRLVVQMTRGVANYNPDVQVSSTKPCTSNLCVKHVSSGGCPFGETCPNFHVDPRYIELARRVTQPLCCGLHNDYFTREMLAGETVANLRDGRFVILLEDRSEVDILPTQLALTTGLDNLAVRNGARVINLRKHICRLHLEGKCKWTKDCGHVHLCRELHKFLNAFHYPSLSFLLSSETDSSKIVSKLKEGSPKLIDFFKTRSARPLMLQMVESDRRAAIEGLIGVGALAPHSIAAKIMERFGLTVPPEQIAPDGDDLEFDQ